jgi:hypothetical protein
MIDRLRFLLDRPLDPLVARAIVVFASAILVGFAGLFALSASESSRPAAAGRPAAPERSWLARSFGDANEEAAPPATSAVAPHRRRQDPQDEKGSPAASRAAKAMRLHRALQHVPYRSGRLSVRLVGARGGRAVLAISAPTIPAARRGWRRFLRRYRDGGHVYLPRFEAAAKAAGSGE